MRGEPSVSAGFKAAVVQFDPKIGELSHNLARMLAMLAEAASAGANLVVFPECALSGYVFDSAEAAMPFTETVPGPASDAFAEACARLNVYAVVGLLERDGDAIYNAAFVVGPQGLLKNYRKCHLPILGVDRFTAKGDEIPVIDLPFAKVGVLICYDLRFPEAPRSLALRGIDLLIIPTNWPEGAQSSPDFLTRARAWENRIYLAACDRVGTERGTTFIGRSQILDVDASVLAEGDANSETILYAAILPERARQKRLVVRPGFEFDLFGGRRPDLYGAITEEHTTQASEVAG